jgi:spore germination protein KC
MKRRIAILLVLLLVAAPLQGCWNYREVDTLNIVAGFAIDKGYEGYKYHMTIDIADTSSAGKDKPVVSTFVETEGDTVFDAVRKAMKKTGYRLYWPDCQIGIIGQDVAQESILPIIDFLMRDAEPRMTMELFVSQEKTAKEVLVQKTTTMSISSFEIDKLYELNELYDPVSPYQLLYEDYNTLASEGRALALPTLHLVTNMDTKTAMLNGTAIFDKDRLKGYLTAEDSFYMLFAMDRIKGGVFNVNPRRVMQLQHWKYLVTKPKSNPRLLGI